MLWCPSCRENVTAHRSVQAEREIDRCGRCQLRLRVSQPGAALARVALVRVEAAAESEPPPPPDDESTTRLELGVALKEMQQYAQAVDQLRGVRRIELRAEARHLMGLCHLEQGDLEIALRHFDVARSAPFVTPDVEACLLMDMATAHEAQGQPGRAERCLREVLTTGEADLAEVHLRLQRLVQS